MSLQSKTRAPGSSQSKLGAVGFKQVQEIVRDQAAIIIPEDKAYLVENRLRDLALRESLDHIDKVLLEMKKGNRGIISKVVEAMTINETSFFRDFHVFEALRDVILPDLFQRRASEKKLNFWCAASSSGQESYSVLMLLHEHFKDKLGSYKVDFRASDISDEMLERVRSGCYSQVEINRGLPAKNLVRYFEKNGLEWQVKPEIRRMLTVEKRNLAQNLTGMPPQDVVFMRNVLIYFDVKTKEAILGRVRKIMKPDGYLLLGGAETTIGMDTAFIPQRLARTVLYRPEEMEGKF